MKILITGSSGFIGRHLVSKLLEQPNVIIYAVSRSQVQEEKENLIPVQADLTKTNWTEALRTPVDIVIHLAQSRQHRNFPSGAEDMIQVNLVSTLNLLEWSRENKVKRFFLASTGNVYKPTEKLIEESDECEPTSMYAASKLCAEFLVKQYAGYFEHVILRLFGVYGPRQENMLIPDMIDRIRTGRPIILAQNIGITMTPLYISDCLSILEKMINPDRSIRGVFNLAGNEIVNMSKLTQMISSYLSKKPILQQIEDTPRSLKGSNKKVCETLPYIPSVSLAEGLKRIITFE
jgi:UDP-glucose 4-epimerase